MLGFYAVRKLIESQKVSLDVVRQQVRLRSYKPRGPKPDHLNWHHLDRHYVLGLDNSNTEERDLGFVCNQMIHSFIFMVGLDDNTNGLDGFFFASDHQRSKALLYIELAVVVGLFEQVGNDHPDAERRIRDPKTGDWVLVKNEDEATALRIRWSE